MVRLHFKRKLKALYVIFCSYIILIGCSFAPFTQREEIDLHARLGKVYSVKNTAEKVEVRYCPDNTCDVISASKSVDQTVFDDFLVLYFARISSYVYLKDFQKSISDKLVDGIREKYEHFCLKRENISTKCIAQGLSEKFKISVLFARFDENEETLVEQKIE